MAMVINSNIMSLNAQRNLMISQGDQNQAMERLSSGKRINSAADDAAGLAISNRMTSQVRGLDQAIRNANDGISLIQTAEGALDETTNILQRIRELSIQSANGTYDDGNRATLNAEVQQLISEIDRISETTKFNGLQILDGTLGQVDLQAGADSYETIALEIGATNSKSLGGASGDIVGEATTNGNLTDLITAYGTGSSSVIQINDQSLTSFTSAATIQEALDSINADLDGFGAEVSTIVEFTADNVGDGQLIAGTDVLQIQVTDNYGNSSLDLEITGTTNLQEVVDQINGAAGGAIEASINDEGKLQLVGEDVAQILVNGTTNDGDEAAGVTAGSSQTANYSLVFEDTSADQRGVKIEGTGTMLASTVDTLGINVQDDDGNLQSVGINTGGTTLNDLNAGDLIINGVEVGAISGGTSNADSVANVVEAINEVSDQTGVVAYANSTGIELRSSQQEEISIQYGDIATDADVEALTGLQERNALNGSGSVASIDISTADGAQRAIEIVDLALEEINSTRGDLGAINNRLDFTINNLSNVSENVAAARSRIEDADFAAESAALSRAQVLQQAGTAMLAQANAAPQQVLSLLQ